VRRSCDAEKLKLRSDGGDSGTKISNDVMVVPIVLFWWSLRLAGA
jgi:hypothetical protein